MEGASDEQCYHFRRARRPRPLERRAIVASGRRISRIMMKNGLVSAYSSTKHQHSGSKPNGAPLPNLLDRRFDGHAPRAHVVGDLTYVRTGRKRSCVCLLVDLCNRETIGHSADDRRDSDLMKEAFATVGPVRHRGASHGPRKRVRQRLLDRQDARGLRHREIPVGEGLPVRQRVIESASNSLKRGTRPPRVVSRHRASAAKGQRVGADQQRASFLQPHRQLPRQCRG